MPDERVLLERDFSIEIPRQATPPIIGQSPVRLFRFAFQTKDFVFSKGSFASIALGSVQTNARQTHHSAPGHRSKTRRIFLVARTKEMFSSRQEPMPKFDLIDDRFGEPLPTTAMDVDQREDRTFFQATSEERTNELLRGSDENIFVSFSEFSSCLSATRRSTGRGD